MKITLLLCLTSIFLTACSTPKAYRGEEVAQLVNRSDFTSAAKAAPAFTREVMQTVARLEYEYYQAKEGAKYCPRCREELRLRLQATVPPPTNAPVPRIDSPPMPPVPVRQP